MEPEIIFLVGASPEGGFEARALGHSIFTQVSTYEELKRNVLEAVRCHFEEGEHPRLIHLVRDESRR
ncbi:MAG: 2-oxoisovalerate dehydrogenase [Gammaproteobacteria bacterium]|nr:MAG: 2-oxoisovalerate dehydrogenase [Gammaproteobacteria bacterium]